MVWVIRMSIVDPRASNCENKLKENEIHFHLEEKPSCGALTTSPRRTRR
jgi:hypothetical protein